MAATDSEVRKRVKAAVATAGSMRAAATELGISVQFVHDLYHGRRAAGPKTLRKLGLKRTVTYESVPPK